MAHSFFFLQTPRAHGVASPGSQRPTAGAAQPLLPTDEANRFVRSASWVTQTAALNASINETEKPINGAWRYLNPRSHCVSALGPRRRCRREQPGYGDSSAGAHSHLNPTSTASASAENDIAVLFQLKRNVFDKITNAWQSTFKLCMEKKRRGKVLYKQQNNSFI